MQRRAFLGALAATSIVGEVALAQTARMQSFLPPGVAPKPKGPVVQGNRVN